MAQIPEDVDVVLGGGYCQSHSLKSRTEQPPPSPCEDPPMPCQSQGGCGVEQL